MNCRLKNRTFSSNDLRDYDFSERKDEGFKIHRTLEVWLSACAAHGWRGRSC